jgi:aspartyl-tRNA(Asn)/glutamyl-tRNA(Gln) amidotransferase subunit A
MAMGSDTGGSIRLPSSMCGVTGLKPTHGAVSLRGALPMTASFDTGGPLARSAEDCRVVFDVIAGQDLDYVYSRTRSQLPVKPPGQTRIALVAGWLAHAHDDVATAVVGVAEELGRLGYTVVEVAGFDPLGMRDDVSPLLVGEFAHHFRDLWDDDRVSEPIAMLMRLGRETSGVDYVKGRERAEQVRTDFMRDLADVDALLAPGAPYPAPKADEVDNLLEAVRSTVYTLPVNAAGLPALAFPTGFSEGLPIGAQLIGPPWAEYALCAIGTAYQQATDWHLRVAPAE